MSKLQRVTLEDLRWPDELREKVVQSNFMIIVEIRHGNKDYENLFRAFESWGVKKIYLEYFESKHLYHPGISQHQVLWSVQKWQNYFPHLTFDILNLQKEVRWTGLRSSMGLVLFLRSLLMMGAVFHLATIHLKLAIIKLFEALKVLVEPWKVSWRQFSIKKQVDRLLTQLHFLARPFKKSYYFLKYLLSKLTKRS